MKPCTGFTTLKPCTSPKRCRCNVFRAWRLLKGTTAVLLKHQVRASPFHFFFFLLLFSFIFFLKCCFFLLFVGVEIRPQKKNVQFVMEKRPTSNDFVGSNPVFFFLIDITCRKRHRFYANLGGWEACQNLLNSHTAPRAYPLQHGSYNRRSVRSHSPLTKTGGAHRLFAVRMDAGGFAVAERHEGS